MVKKFDRRSFLKKGLAAGASTFLASHGGVFLKSQYKKIFAAESAVNISVVVSENYFKGTLLAIEQLGGMKRFVPEGARVALLPNAQRNNPGAYTKPDIVKAVIKLCREAGAKEVNVLSMLPQDNWRSTGLEAAILESGGKLVLIDRKDESLFKAMPVPNGRTLKEAKIMSELFRHDIFINIPITKDHIGNRFTGTMKNLMGLNFPQSNRTFHTGMFESKPDDVNHLDQCIADLNTIIKPDLCVVDATEFIITNGPFGPGEIIKPKKIVCGTDRVAIDSYCCRLWDLTPSDIVMIKKGYEHGLGEIDPAKVSIKEIQI